MELNKSKWEEKDIPFEVLKQIFVSALAKVDDIRTVSLNNAILKTVRCALAFSGHKNVDVEIVWGE